MDNREEYKYNLKMVKRYGYHLKDIPSEKRTKELCIAAFEQNPVMFKYIPKKLITKALCKEALQEYDNAFQYVPKNFQTKRCANKQ